MSTSPVNSENSNSHIGPKLRQRLRALLLAQQELYRKLIQLMSVQIESLKSNGLDNFIQRLTLEDQILGQLSAVDKVIRPLELQMAETVLDDEMQRLQDQTRELWNQAREAHQGCQNQLAAVTSEFKEKLPVRKRISRFAGGDLGRPGNFVDLKA